MLLTLKRNIFYKPADSVKTSRLLIHIKNIGTELKSLGWTLITVCVYKSNPLGVNFPGTLLDIQEFKIEHDSDEITINGLVCCSGQYVTISSHNDINVDISISVSRNTS